MVNDGQKARTHGPNTTAGHRAAEGIQRLLKVKIFPTPRAVRQVLCTLSRLYSIEMYTGRLSVLCAWRFRIPVIANWLMAMIAVSTRRIAATFLFLCMVYLCFPIATPFLSLSLMGGTIHKHKLCVMASPDGTFFSLNP